MIRVFCLLVYCVLVRVAELSSASKLPYIASSDLSQVLSERCALLGVPPYGDNQLVPELLASLQLIYARDQDVLIGQLHAGDQFGALSLSANGAYSSNQSSLVLYKRNIKDRSCLIQPPNAAHHVHAQLYSGDLSVDSLVSFVNEGCGTFRTTERGKLTRAGLRRERMHGNLYGVSRDEDGAECLRIKMPSTSVFVRDYLFRSRPVVIEGAINDWPAREKWTTEFLLEMYGNNTVHVKLTPDGNFEGVESADRWKDYRWDRIPESVRAQLLFPDLVVVRPASAEMKFSQFLDLTMAKNKSYSAYLEYSSIPYYMPELTKDVKEPPFVEGLLHKHHLNMWLSDGRTLGKLHFDPYDNLLCQLSGEKRLILFDPHHNENLYEGHIPEALLSFDSTSATFHRRQLLESTSMVMSPVDPAHPDLQRFPNYSKANKLECTLRPGDALFMPAFWWHEVQSYPDPLEHRNLAVNFWYEPLLTKEFPCAECRLNFNLFYRQLLEDLQSPED
ncbi:hypothetical protein EMCRGX_G027656 [Ephydatia muelleri]